MELATRAVVIHPSRLRCCFFTPKADGKHSFHSAKVKYNPRQAPKLVWEKILRPMSGMDRSILTVLRKISLYCRKPGDQHETSFDHPLTLQGTHHNPAELFTFSSPITHVGFALPCGIPLSHSRGDKVAGSRCHGTGMESILHARPAQLSLPQSLITTSQINSTSLPAECALP